MSGYGFYWDPGKASTVGVEPEIARRLDALAKSLHLRIYGISGYRTPARSVAVGGFPNDPHTQGRAIDIGVNGQLRASAAQLTDQELANFGLVRPFPGAAEVNHIQLDPTFQSKGGFPHGGSDAASGGLIPGSQYAQQGINTIQDAISAIGGWNAMVSFIFSAKGLLTIALVLGGLGVSRTTGARVDPRELATALHGKATA
jgi:hypothetical protein